MGYMMEMMRNYMRQRYEVMMMYIRRRDMEFDYLYNINNYTKYE